MDENYVKIITPVKMTASRIPLFDLIFSSDVLQILFLVPVPEQCTCLPVFLRGCHVNSHPYPNDCLQIYL